MKRLLLSKIYFAVKEHISTRTDSLNALSVLSNKISFEGWLKVETIFALNKCVHKIQNKGSDLKLNDGSTIELKASMDAIHKGFFYHRTNGKYSDPVLLIAGGNIEKLMDCATIHGMEVVEAEALNDSLVIAMVIRTMALVDREERAPTDARRYEGM